MSSAAPTPGGVPASSKMFNGDLAFLSNFYREAFYLPILGVEVATAEHGFNALKTRAPEQRAYVLAAASPGEAKRRGRSVDLREDWDTGGRVRTMQQVLGAKFTPPHMRAALLSTGNLPLVETNAHHDDFWGDCRCPRHYHAVGVNMLGELLMALRTFIREA